MLGQFYLFRTASASGQGAITGAAYLRGLQAGGRTSDMVLDVTVFRVEGAARARAAPIVELLPETGGAPLHSVVQLTGVRQGAAFRIVSTETGAQIGTLRRVENSWQLDVDTAEFVRTIRMSAPSGRGAIAAEYRAEMMRDANRIERSLGTTAAEASHLDFVRAFTDLGMTSPLGAGVGLPF